MIFDNIKNKELYLSINDGFKAGFDFIEKAIKENLPVGKYEIDGKKVWASVQEYLSKDEAKAEAHRNYIDIQYIVSGKESMLNANIDLCKTVLIVAIFEVRRWRFLRFPCSGIGKLMI